MKVLLLDVIHDLKVKRLWPLAVVLLVAMVAVPVVLLRDPDASEVAAPAPLAEAPSPLGTSIKLTDKPEGGSSDLGQFDRHNPFRPKLPPEKEPAEAASDSSGAGSTDATQGAPSPPPATDASAEGTTPSGSGSQATPPGKSPAGGGGGSSNESKNDGSENGNKSSGKNNGSDKAEEDVRLLSYNADTAYGPAGQVKKHTVEPNDVFPRGERYFMYSGVSKDGKAIFTVLDPTLVSERKGEGHCVQVSGRCAVLHLQDGEERRFENETGEGFVIRLGALDPVKKLVEDLSGKLRDTVDKLLDPLEP